MAAAPAPAAAPSHGGAGQQHRREGGDLLLARPAPLDTDEVIAAHRCPPSLGGPRGNRGAVRRLGPHHARAAMGDRSNLDGAADASGGVGFDGGRGSESIGPRAGRHPMGHGRHKPSRRLRRCYAALAKVPLTCEKALRDGGLDQCGKSAPGRTRTCGQALRRRLLYPLSYGGRCVAVADG